MFTVKIKKLMSHAEDEESERLHTAFDFKSRMQAKSEKMKIMCKLGN